MERLLNKSRVVFWVLFAFAGILAFLPGCKSTRPLSRAKVLEKPFDEVYKGMMEQQASFKNLSLKMAIVVHTESKESTTVKAQMRVKADSLIWCSIVPAMGIEVARVQISHDSVKLINRMKKNYVKGSYRLLDSLLHTSVNYRGLEALLLAEPITQDHNIDGFVSVDGQFYKLRFNEKEGPDTLKMRNNGLQQTLWVDPQTFLIKKMLVINPDDQSRSIQVFYDAYMQVNGKYFPSHIKFFIFAEKKMQIDVVVRKLELKNTLTFPFHIPQNYVKL